MDEQHSTGSMDNAELRLTNKKLTFDRFQSFRTSFFPKKENKLNKNENMIIENNDEINNNLIVTMCKSDKHNKTIDNDIILIEDILYKKSPFVYYNKRYCKLFSKGHLDYYHFPTKVFKGSIIINENADLNITGGEIKCTAGNTNGILNTNNAYLTMNQGTITDTSTSILFQG